MEARDKVRKVWSRSMTRNPISCEEGLKGGFDENGRAHDGFDGVKKSTDMDIWRDDWLTGDRGTLRKVAD